MLAYIQKSILLVLLFLALSPESFAQEDTSDDSKPVLKVGGALRFNYNLSTWKDGQIKRGGDFGYDVFRINVLGNYKGISLNAEYRLYSQGFGGGMLKQGWLGYNFSDKSELQVGLNQVPFGIQQYNSHNWFFNLPYYIGFEDDHDMGVKYIKDTGPWQWQVAYYLNAEDLVFSDVEASPNRYSYDITGRNKENNQLNLKAIRRIGNNLQHEIGASVMGGLLYNLDTEKNGSRVAGALHYEYIPSEDTPWSLKLQAMTYKFNPEYLDTELKRDQVTMGAYGANYNVAAAGDVYTGSVSYLLPVSSKVVQSLTFYNNYSYFNKRKKSFESSHMNVLGCMVTAGQVYTYVDFAGGYNQPWLGPAWEEPFAEGTPGDTRWHMRFNINLGYYF